jgi:nucleoside 2-deoxyribosyltransferase
MKINSIYLIGSLRNPKILELGNQLRLEGFEVFNDWMAAGPEADDYWQKYEQSRGRTYSEALKGYAAQSVYHFDKLHLDRCDAAVLVLPAGKSGHLELGYMIGKGKPGFILLDKEPERFDVMYNFATAVCSSPEELFETFNGPKVTPGVECGDCGLVDGHSKFCEFNPGGVNYRG